MYSGSTLTRFSGRVLGAHQKIDSVARRHLSWVIPDEAIFPGIRQILHFEGKNGPDAIKRKSPAKDEPWHYINPFDESDTQLIDLIHLHFEHLVTALKEDNKERMAFEAAWLAHSIVDGLTPAHHFPYEEKLSELRGGLSNSTRTTIKEKLVIPGETASEMVKNNWKMWGAKGLFLTHGLFEIGIATLIKPLTFNDVIPTKEDLIKAETLGIDELFRRAAREIAVLDMYHSYYERGWTPRLAYNIRHKLGPVIVQTVTLAWYLALYEAEKLQPIENKT
jgi:hypothetical protein